MGRTTTRHVPLRRCVLCRASKPQAEQLRLTREGDVVRLDLARKLGGRGIWVCRDCAAADNEKRLRQVFKGQAPSVALLLAQALAATPNPPKEDATRRLRGDATRRTGSATMHENNGGTDVR